MINFDSDNFIRSRMIVSSSWDPDTFFCLYGPIRIRIRPDPKLQNQPKRYTDRILNRADYYHMLPDHINIYQDFPLLRSITN